MSTTPYTRTGPDGATDLMAGYEGFGEMLSYTGAIDAEQSAVTLRRMPAGTGGRGSYGHRHKTQEEIYLVMDGEVTFKVGDDVFTCGPRECVRVAADAWRSVHNDGTGDAVLIICSPRSDDPEGELETVADFWP
jgi:mannose-6-phosphate isomerase-like protein (cupin superfamily)